jgi:hypothetical protein
MVRSFDKIARRGAREWNHDRMRPKTWQGVVGRASLKNQPLGFELQAKSSVIGAYKAIRVDGRGIAGFLPSF